MAGSSTGDGAGAADANPNRDPNASKKSVKKDIKQGKFQPVTKDHPDYYSRRQHIGRALGDKKAMADKEANSGWGDQIHKAFYPGHLYNKRKTERKDRRAFKKQFGGYHSGGRVFWSFLHVLRLMSLFLLQAWMDTSRATP